MFSLGPGGTAVTPRRGRRDLPLAALWLVLPLILWPSGAGAVTFVEQANRLQLIYAGLFDLRPAQSPLPVDRSEWSLGLELIPTPEVDTRVGGKEEPIDPPALIPRARLRWVGGSGLLAGISLGPPLEVQDYTAPWLAFELGMRGRIGGLALEVRLHAIDGEVEGPITDANTKDRFRFENQGLDLRAGLPLGRWSVYGGGGQSETESELEVTSDGARIALEERISYLLAGIEYRGADWRFVLEQNRTEDFLNHVILSLVVNL